MPMQAPCNRPYKLTLLSLLSFVLVLIHAADTASLRNLRQTPNSMQQKSDWEVDSHPTGPKIPNILWNTEAHYDVKSPPPADASQP
jgi:hypothetical protein